MKGLTTGEYAVRVRTLYPCDPVRLRIVVYRPAPSMVLLTPNLHPLSSPASHILPKCPLDHPCTHITDWPNGCCTHSGTGTARVAT